MDEVEQFEAVLRELGELMIDLGDLASSVVLIGGQVLALESRRRGHSGVIAVETETGEEVTRGFTFEPDLLFDLAGPRHCAVCGYNSICSLPKKSNRVIFPPRGSRFRMRWDSSP